MTLKTWQRTLLIAITAIGVSWQVFTSGPSFEKLPQSAKHAILRDRDTVDSLFQKTASAIKTGKLTDAQEYINNAKRLLKDISEFAPEISILTEKVDILRNLVQSITAIQTRLDNLRKLMQIELAKLDTPEGGACFRAGEWNGPVLRFRIDFINARTAIQETKDIDKELSLIAAKIIDEQKAEMVQQFAEWVEQFRQLEKKYPHDNRFPGFAFLFATEAGLY